MNDSRKRSDNTSLFSNKFTYFGFKTNYLREEEYVEEYPIYHYVAQKEDFISNCIRPFLIREKISLMKVVGKFTIPLFP